MSILIENRQWMWDLIALHLMRITSHLEYGRPPSESWLKAWLHLIAVNKLTFENNASATMFPSLPRALLSYLAGDFHFTQPCILNYTLWQHIIDKKISVTTGLMRLQHTGAKSFEEGLERVMALLYFWFTSVLVCMTGHWVARKCGHFQDVLSHFYRLCWPWP